MVMVTVTTELPYPSHASKDGADAVGAIDADRPANDLDSDAAGRGILDDERLLKSVLPSVVNVNVFREGSVHFPPLKSERDRSVFLKM